MISYTPRTDAELTAALAVAPRPTAPFLARLARLTAVLSRSARCDLRARFDSDAEYAATLRLFGSTRVSRRELLVLLLGRQREACAAACLGRDVVAILDTTTFTLPGLAGRQGGPGRQAEAPEATFGHLGDGATPGVKAHVVFCCEARTHRPLGLALRPRCFASDGGRRVSRAPAAIARGARVGATR